MHQNALKSFLIVCATLLFVFAFSIAYNLISNVPGNSTFPISNTLTDGGIDSVVDDIDTNPAYIGVLRETGLNGIESEKSRLNLSVSDYELANIVKEATSDKEKFQLMFIEDTYFDYKNYLGKCVRAKVKLLEYPNYVPGNAYMGVPVNVTSLTLADDSIKCSPYLGAADPADTVYKTLSGVLKRFERPSPDIDYDYALALDEPYYDENNASGMGMYVKTYVVIPDTSEIWLKVEDNISKHVTLNGYFSWGFAESKYFTITGLTPTIKQ